MAKRTQAPSNVTLGVKLVDAVWTRASALYYLTAATIVASLLLGGGTAPGFLSDVILQLAALPLLFVSISKLLNTPATQQMRVAIAFCMAVALIPILQLIPLPPAIWTLLPNRGISADAYAALGEPLPWMPISVSPEATWLSGLSLVPPLAIFFGTMLLTYRERRSLSLVVLAVTLVSVFLGLVQVAQGPGSALRFFRITNPAEAVGFFANRNHFAALIYCMLPVLGAWTVHVVRDLSARLQAGQHDPLSILAALAAFIGIVLMLSGEVMARSRAGLGLTIIALFGVLALNLDFRDDARSDRSGRMSLKGLLPRGGLSGIFSGFTPAKLVVIAIALALTFAVQFALYRLQERFEAETVAGARPVFTANTAEAARKYMPFGAGLGTFMSVYPLVEKPQDVLINTYVNHAHNDAVELWLETGIVGLILMGLFVSWLLLRSFAVWIRPPPGANDIDWLLIRAATISVALLLVHSLVDYPLRTSGMTAIMAFLCALLIEPPHAAEEPEPLRLAKPEPAPHRSRKRSASLPSPGPTPAADVPAWVAPQGDVRTGPQEQRWGTDINWPKEWSKDAKRGPRGGGSEGST